jgi:hypothetical protein
MTRPPHDRSRPELLTKDQRAEWRTFDGLEPSITSVRSAPLPSSMPVRVITAGRPWWPTEDRRREWRAAHERLAASVADGPIIVADRSGHRVDLQQPELIVETVASLVNRARRSF